MLTDKQIIEFQEIYIKEFGVKIDKKEALDKGVQLIRLFQILSKNLTINNEIDKKTIY